MTIKMKKILTLFVILLFISSTIVIGEDTTLVEEESLWDSVKEFLWGSSEARAGAGWFDRSGDLPFATGQGEAIPGTATGITSCKTDTHQCPVHFGSDGNPVPIYRIKSTKEISGSGTVWHTGDYLYYYQSPSGLMLWAPYYGAGDTGGWVKSGNPTLAAASMDVAGSPGQVKTYLSQSTAVFQLGVYQDQYTSTELTHAKEQVCSSGSCDADAVVKQIETNRAASDKALSGGYVSFAGSGQLNGFTVYAKKEGGEVKYRIMGPNGAWTGDWVDSLPADVIVNFKAHDVTATTTLPVGVTVPSLTDFKIGDEAPEYCSKVGDGPCAIADGILEIEDGKIKEKLTLAEGEPGAYGITSLVLVSVEDEPAVDEPGLTVTPTDEPFPLEPQVCESVEQGCFVGSGWDCDDQKCNCQYYGGCPDSSGTLIGGDGEGVPLGTVGTGTSKKHPTQIPMKETIILSNAEDGKEYFVNGGTVYTPDGTVQTGLTLSSENKIVVRPGYTYNGKDFSTTVKIPEGAQARTIEGGQVYFYKQVGTQLLRSTDGKVWSTGGIPTGVTTLAELAKQTGVDYQKVTVPKAGGSGGGGATTPTALAKVGIDLTTPKGINAFQDSIIAKMPKGYVCEGSPYKGKCFTDATKKTEISCVGKISGSKCVHDGIAGTGTKAAAAKIVTAAAAKAAASVAKTSPEIKLLQEQNKKVMQSSVKDLLGSDFAKFEKQIDWTQTKLEGLPETVKTKAGDKEITFTYDAKTGLYNSGEEGEAKITGFYDPVKGGIVSMVTGPPQDGKLPVLEVYKLSEPVTTLKSTHVVLLGGMGTIDRNEVEGKPGIVRGTQVINTKGEDGKLVRDPTLSGETISMDGIPTVFQSDADKAAGSVTVNGQSYAVKDKDAFTKLESGEKLTVLDEDGEIIKDVQVDLGSKKVTSTDHETERQTTITTKGKDADGKTIVEELSMQGTSSEEGKIFKPRSGFVTENGKAKYIIASDTFIDKDKTKPKTSDLLDPSSGLSLGTRHADFEGYGQTDITRSGDIIIITNKGVTQEFREVGGVLMSTDGKGTTVAHFLENVKIPPTQLTTEQQGLVKEGEAAGAYESSIISAKRTEELDANRAESEKIIPKMVVFQDKIQDAETIISGNLPSIVGYQFHLDNPDQRHLPRISYKNPDGSLTYKTDGEYVAFLKGEVARLKQENLAAKGVITASEASIQELTTKASTLGGASAVIKGKTYDGLPADWGKIKDSIVRDGLITALGGGDFNAFAEKAGVTQKEIGQYGEAGSSAIVSTNPDGGLMITSETQGMAELKAEPGEPITAAKIKLGLADKSVHVTDEEAARIAETHNKASIENKAKLDAQLAKEQVAIKAAEEAKAKAEKTPDSKKTTGLDAAAKESAATSFAQGAQTTLSAVYAIAGALDRDYSPLNQLWDDQEWYKDWKGSMDAAFAPLMLAEAVPSAICEGHYDIQPEGTAILKTVSGTYQYVAHIEGEISDRKAPILCKRNPDQEADDEFICDEGQVCVNEGFCYVDEDQNGQADEEKPVEGYMYKITWGTSAPLDETQTLYTDENGVAVSFNVWVYPSDGSKAKPIYRKEANIKGPIQLSNGDRDKDLILRYTGKKYGKVCIEWDLKMKSYLDGNEIKEICSPFKTVVSGTVDFNSAGGQSESVKSSSGEIQTTSNW